MMVCFRDGDGRRGADGEDQRADANSRSVETHPVSDSNNFSHFKFSCNNGSVENESNQGVLLSNAVSSNADYLNAKNHSSNIFPDCSEIIKARIWGTKIYPEASMQISDFEIKNSEVFACNAVKQKQTELIVKSIARQINENKDVNDQLNDKDDVSVNDQMEQVIDDLCDDVKSLKTEMGDLKDQIGKLVLAMQGVQMQPAQLNNTAVTQIQSVPTANQQQLMPGVNDPNVNLSVPNVILNAPNVPVCAPNVNLSAPGVSYSSQFGTPQISAPVIHAVPAFQMNREMLLPKFDFGRGLKLSEFLRKFEAHARAQGIPLDAYSMVLEKYLIGTALDAFTDLGGSIKNYKFIKDSLLRIFKEDEDDDLHLIDKLNIIYEPAKGISYLVARVISCADQDRIGNVDYEFKFYRKIVDLLPAELRHLFAKEAYDEARREGRTRPNLDDIARSSEFMSVYVRTAETGTTASYAQVMQKNSGGAKNGDQNRFEKKPIAKDEKCQCTCGKCSGTSKTFQSNSNNKKFWSKYKCYNCGAYGHISRFCKKPKRPDKQQTKSQEVKAPVPVKNDGSANSQAKGKDESPGFYSNKFQNLHDFMNSVSDQICPNVQAESNVANVSNLQVQQLNVNGKSNIMKETHDKLFKGKNIGFFNVSFKKIDEFYKKFEFRKDITCKNKKCKFSHSCQSSVTQNVVAEKNQVNSSINLQGVNLAQQVVSENGNVAHGAVNNAEQNVISENNVINDANNLINNNCNLRLNTFRRSLSDSNLYRSCVDPYFNQSSNVSLNVNLDVSDMSDYACSVVGAQNSPEEGSAVADSNFEIRDFCIVDCLLTCSINLGKCSNITALFDAGSQLSLVKDTLKDRISNEWVQSPISVSGAGSNSRSWSTMQAKGAVEIAGISFMSSDLYAVNSQAMPENVDIILGRTWLAMHECQIDFGNRSLLFLPEVDPNGVRFTLMLDDPINPIFNLEGIAVYAAETVHAKRGEPVKVRAKVEGDFQHLIKSILLGSFVGSAIKYDMVLELLDEFTVDLPNTVLISDIFNEGVAFIAGDNITINNGQLIGHAHSCVRVKKPSFYTILRDQDLVDNLRNRPADAEKAEFEPEENAVLDHIHKYPEDMPYNEVPDHLRCADTARIFPPRNMNRFDEIYSRSAGHFQDRIQDGWSRDRLLSEIKIYRENMTPEQISKIEESCWKYRVVFSRQSYDISVGAVAEVQLQITDGARPVKTAVRRMPDAANKILDATADEFLKSGILEECAGSWISPVHIVYRTLPDGSKKARVVNDFRKVNTMIRNNAFYLRGIPDIMQQVGHKNFFSKADMKSAYHMLSIAPSSRDITGIIIANKYLRYTVLPFGIQVATGLYTAIMDKIFVDFSIDEMSRFLDDNFLYSISPDEHVDLIDKFLRKCAEHRLKMSPSKCEFFAKKIEFLGYTVSSEGYCKTKEYVEKVFNIKKPETWHDMQKFLGIVNYQRAFIKACSEIVAPLAESIHGITKKTRKKKLVWTQDMETAFIKIKQEIANDVSLSFIDSSPNAEKIIIKTDASDLALGAVVTQKQLGQDRIICFLSRRLETREKRYSVIDKELLAIIWAVERAAPFILGRSFVVQTDHRALKYLFVLANKSPRLARALDRLSQFNFEVEYIPGEKNILADEMSRPVHENELYPGQDLVENMDTFYLPPNHVVVKVPGGPSALLQALEMSRTACMRCPSDAIIAQLRQDLVKELLSNVNFYKLQNVKSSLQVYSNMHITPTLDMCKAYANIFNVKIEMYVGVEQPLAFLPSGDNDFSVIKIVCLGQSVHFEPLITSNSKDECLVGQLNWVVLEELACKKGVENWEEQFAQWETVDSDIGEIVPINSVKVVEAPTHNNSIWILPIYAGKCCHNQAHAAADFIMRDEKCILCIEVDPAAGMSAISKSALLQLNTWGVNICNLVNNNDLRIRCFGGHTLTPEKHVKIALHLPNIGLVEHQFYVLEDRDLPCCIVLGADFLNEHYINVRYTKNDNLFSENKENLRIKTNLGISYQVMHAEPAPTRRNSYATSVVCAVQMCERVKNKSKFFFNKRVVEADYNEILTDNDFKKLFDAVKNGVCFQAPSIFQHYFKKFYLNEQGKLMFGRSYVVSINYFMKIVTKLHEDWLHAGAYKLFGFIRDIIWHPKCREILNQVTSTCPICQCSKDFNAIAKAPIKRTVAHEPFELVSMDVVSFEKGTYGNEYAVVITDRYSKWVQVYPLQNHTAQSIIKVLDAYLSSIPRCPDLILSDGSTEFRSNIVEKYFLDCGIQHIYSAEYRPNTNGQVENSIKNLISKLRTLKLGDKKIAWDNALENIVDTFNLSVHATTKVSPANVVLQDTGVVGKPQGDLGATWVKGSARFKPYKVGDKVLIKCHYTGDRRENKFKPVFKGIFTVTKIKGSGLIYELADALNENVIIKKNIHYNDMRPFKFPDQFSLQCESFKNCFLKWFHSVFADYEMLMFEMQDENVENESVNDAEYVYSGKNQNDENEIKMLRYNAYLWNVQQLNVILNELGMQSLPLLNFDTFDPQYEGRVYTILNYLQDFNENSCLKNVAVDLIESIQRKVNADKLVLWFDADRPYYSYLLEAARLSYNYFHNYLRQIDGANLENWEPIIGYYHALWRLQNVNKNLEKSLKNVLSKVPPVVDREGVKKSNFRKNNNSSTSSNKVLPIENEIESSFNFSLNKTWTFDNDAVQSNYRLLPEMGDLSACSDSQILVNGLQEKSRRLSQILKNVSCPNINDLCNNLIVSEHDAQESNSFQVMGRSERDAAYCEDWSVTASPSNPPTPVVPRPSEQPDEFNFLTLRNRKISRK